MSPVKWPTDTCVCGATKMVRSATCRSCFTRWPDRFWSRVFKTPDCWLWVGGQIDKNGYGIVSLNGKNHKAHRVAWEMENGPIPNGLTIDHLCVTNNCVRASHMEPVTLSENTRRRHARARAAKAAELFA